MQATTIDNTAIVTGVCATQVPLVKRQYATTRYYHALKRGRRAAQHPLDVPCDLAGGKRRGPVCLSDEQEGSEQ